MQIVILQLLNIIVYTISSNVVIPPIPTTMSSAVAVSQVAGVAAI